MRSPMSDVTTWEAVMETSQMFCTGPTLLQAGIEVSSALCAAVVTPLRHAATQLTGLWRRRQPMMVWDPWEPVQPGVYKAITACPGSWIIRVRTSIMKVGCVSVRCAAATLLQAFYLQCKDSDSLCNPNIWCHSKNITIGIELSLMAGPASVTSLQ